MIGQYNRLLVTGGAGFIGSHFVDLAINLGAHVLVVDKMTYAGNLENLSYSQQTNKLTLSQSDICNSEIMDSLLKTFLPDAVLNFAAESHVDNSIAGPEIFVTTNVLGTFRLLESCRKYYDSLPSTKKQNFKYIQISTDEVFGDLGQEGFFHEKSAYNPHSPYSATKASADHLVRAWKRTYGLPTIITNCSNNYGPRQYPEKLIPHILQCALALKPLPVYGRGTNIRDWIHVTDHCHGVWLALTKGQTGQSYCFGGRAEMANIDVVKLICKILDKDIPRNDGKSYSDLIHFVTDRPGHDWRYAIDDSFAEKSLGFSRKFPSFEEGIHQTIHWYLKNPDWTKSVLTRKNSL